MCRKMYDKLLYITNNYEPAFTSTNIFFSLYMPLFQLSHTTYITNITCAKHLLAIYDVQN